MPALPNVAAYIIDGTVVNVSALSTENDYKAAHALLADSYDSILIVAEAGIGWEEYKPGKLRMPAPSPDCVWKEKAQEWDCPAPEEATDGSD
jgi:hypothetical protein